MRDGAVTLICVPHAGGVSSEYRRWAPALPPDWSVDPVCLPGRESRFREPLLRDVGSMADVVVEAALRVSGTAVVLGHSLGALVAFEAVRKLEAARRGPALLVVAGHRAPHLPRDREPVHALPDDRLLEKLRELGGMPPEILADADLLELVLPRIRADLEAAETHVSPRDATIECPMLALAGASDTSTPEADVAAWGLHARGRYEDRVLPGGHFFVHTHTRDVLHVVREALGSLR